MRLRRINRLKVAFSESKLGSPLRGGEREESSFPQQQPIFTRGKLSLKSSLLLEAANREEPFSVISALKRHGIWYNIRMASNKVTSRLLLLMLTVCGVHARVHGEALENEAMRISFAGAERGFAIESVENLLSGNVRFVHPATNDVAFWKLDFVYRQAGAYRHVTVDNRAPAVSRKAVRTDQGACFVWKGIDLADEKGALDVTADVRLPPGAAASEWRLYVTNRSSRTALHSTSYPLLKTVTPDGRGDVLMPFKELGALLLKGYAGKGREESAWTPGWRPPVTAFNIGDAGLYIAAHDPEMRSKCLVVGKGQDVRFDTVVENAGCPGLAAEGPRYAVVVAAYRGDWWQAAKLYRAWALKQKWTARGPIATRRDFPRAMAEMDLLLRINEKDPFAMSNHVVAVRRIWPDLKVGIHWYGWSPQIFCVNFPEFFPARPHVTKIAAFARRQGVPLMPYLDVRSWDVDMASWAYARRDACRDIGGKTFDEVYSPGHRLAIMCPSSPEWAEVCAKLTHDAIEIGTVNGAGFGGVYHDQVACSRPQPCWAKNHSHPKGGGAWWAEGYRRAFAPIHEWCAKRNAPILSEGTDDTYLDLVDGYLKASCPCGEEVPFHPAVYSGHAIYYGCYENIKDDADSFRAYQMRDFTRGVLLGWLDRWNATAPEFAVQQRLWGRLARIRRAAADFMIYGTLEDELRFAEPPPEKEVVLTHTWTGKTRSRFSMPTVVGTVWRDRSGAVGVVAANWTATAQTVRFRPPATGLKPVELKGETPPVFSEDAEGFARLTLAPHQVAFLRVN